ncbi:unnamed protein product [Cunninghamella blakesleeana]
MRRMLNSLLNIEIECLVVCGLCVDGFVCKLYKLDIPFNEIYRLIEIDSFQLPRNMDDLVKTRSILISFFNIKDIIDTTAKNLERMMKYRKTKKNIIIITYKLESNIEKIVETRM